MLEQQSLARQGIFVNFLSCESNLENSNEFATFAMKTTELKRLLKLYGCYEVETSVKGHDVWYSPITQARFRVPRHQSKEIAKGTVNAILKQAGI